MPSPRSFTVISLGGGVRSSVVALMASQGSVALRETPILN